MKRLAFLLLIMCMTPLLHAQVTLTINPAERGTTIGARHYGIFFEEINHAGDGGLYAELIRNRSFEDNSSTEYWSTSGKAMLERSTENLLNEAQGGCAVVTLSGFGDGIGNTGFWGINVAQGFTYTFSMFVNVTTNTKLRAVLLSETGDTIGSTPVTITGQDGWQKVEATIIPTASSGKGSFALVCDQNEEVQFGLDMVSLFPPTYKDRPNGCRKDLAQMLADMKPAFMRFPGGCYIEGQFSNGKTNRFEWKKTIGPIETRPGHQNVNWNYRVSDGLGFHEMLQLAEDIGAEPLFVVNIGLGHYWYADLDSLQPFIDEALDALEYCNGDTTTTYGKLRKANGHAEPFNLKLIEIGNENYNYYANNNSDQSYQYAERYYKFYQAIKEKYPDVTCIGNVEAWSTDNPSWRNEYPVDAVDEHYYRTPGWFVNQYEKYDSYDRSISPKVYAGEYAVTSSYGTTGDIAAALGEAVYMEGMENNSDICIMGSYAPIFVNENDQKWMPDMIRFNSSEAYGTPSYYVQKLMPNYVGKENVKWTESGNRMTEGAGYGGLSTWDTSATFQNYKVTKADGTVYTAKFDGTESWTNQGGSWSESDGVLTQSSTYMEGKLYLNNNLDLGDKYTIEVDATKTGGKEGFLIAFNYHDANNYVWWNLGGWSNTKHAVEVCENASKTTVQSAYGYLVTGQTYHLKIVVDGDNAKCYMDNDLMFDFTIPASKSRKVYVSSNINDETGKLYVKMVNPNSDAYTTTINLTGYHANGGKFIQMKGYSQYSENALNYKYDVIPTESTILTSGSTLTITIPAYSFNIAELNVSEGEHTESSLTIPEDIYYLNRGWYFLSRGQKWGTQAALDQIGLPISVEKTDEGYHLRYLDRTDEYLGKDGVAYTDKSIDYPITWQFIDAGDDQVYLYNTDTQEYLGLNEDTYGCILVTEAGDALPFKLMTVKQYDELMERGWNDVIARYGKKTFRDVTDKLTNPTMATGTDGWTVWADRPNSNGSWWGTSTNNAGVNEAFQKACHLYQTVTGLIPYTPYRFSLKGFFRPGVNTYAAAQYDKGYSMVNAYIYARGSGYRIKRLADWASDRTSDTEPDNMAAAADCFKAGKYDNSVLAYADSAGTLTVGLYNPEYLVKGWLIWGEAKLEELADATNYIYNPSFEYGLSGWDRSGMAYQTNNEAKASKHLSYYCESWVNANNYTLSDVYVQQTLTGLPDGDYKIIATCHAENQNYPNEKVVGAYLFAGDNKTAVGATGDYEVIGTAVNGSLTIGFKTESTNANWITVDNFRIIKVGESIESYRNILLSAIEKLQTLLATKKILSQEQKDDANAVITDALSKETKEDIIAATTTVNNLYDELNAYRLDIKRHDPYVGYLFAYFPSNSDENLYYAYSKDGFNYTPLNNGSMIMASDTVAIMSGIRDPHVMRGQDGKTFYMVATDMRCALGWASNRGIVMYKSTDLIHWTHSTVNFPTRFPDTWANVTRVWAPETIWDPDYVNTDGTKGRYMVYFSLLTNDGTCTYDKVYYCHANDDFTDLIEEPQYFYDRGSATIDADIIYDECDQLYHMIYKNEGSGGICHITAETLTPQNGSEPGSQWGKPSGTIQQTTVAVEGGGMFRLINSNNWVVMYDCYGSGYYQFCETSDWTRYTLKAQTYTSGMFTPRHGAVLPITPDETRNLLKAFPTSSISFDDADINCDGVVNLEDVKYVVSIICAEIDHQSSADLNNSGTVDAIDINTVISAICK